MAFRDSPLQALKAPLTWTAAAVAAVVALASLGLIFADHKTSASAYGPARGEFDELMEPVLNVLSAPVRWAGAVGDFFGDYVLAGSQNRELKKEVVELQRWRDAAIALKNLNLRYEALLKLRTEPPIAMVTARAVSDARGPFSDARLLDAGSQSGIKIGNPAMSEDGVVGRVVGVAKSASRILLLTDVESRTPVLIDRTNARAILTGDGGPNPKLDFVRGANPVQEGDMILTSGDGGLYPRGLPVGVAAKDFRGVWRARLYSDRAAVDFVRILLFNDFSQAVNQADLVDNAMPAMTPEEQSQFDAAKAAAAKPPSAAGAAATPTAPPASTPSRPAHPPKPEIRLKSSPPSAETVPKAKQRSEEATP